MSNIAVYEQLTSLDEQTQKLTIEKSLLLDKAFKSGDVNTIWKAQQYYNNILKRQPQQAQSGPSHKSLLFDPFEATSSQGYYNKKAQISFEVLRAMSRTPIVYAAITTRKDQVAEHCVPQPDKYSPGFVIRKKKRKGQDEKDTTDQEKRKIDELTEFIINCAVDEETWDLDDFNSFIRKIVDDSLALDQVTFEVVQNIAREPLQIVPVDAATIRIADSWDQVNNTKQTEKKDGFFPKYVQIYQNVIVNEYYPWEMCFGVRNPSSELRANGYGKSELEILIATVTAMLNADSYNHRFFRNGTAPKGALMVKGGTSGSLNRDKIEELKREWNATMSGVENMHKTPIMNADQMEWIDMQKTNRDMEFSSYQEYLIKLVCACYKISPEEIGFPLKGTQSSGLGSATGGKEEKEYSKDKGLKPLLKSIETWINKFIIGPKTNFLYEFIFAGVDTEDSQAEEERLTKAVTTYMTIDEVRAVRELDPLPNGEGDIILNPIIAQGRQAKQQMDMQQQQMQAQQASRSGNPFEQSTYDEQDQAQTQKAEDEGPFVKAVSKWWDENMMVK